MLYLVIWSLVLALLAVWSLLTWALNSASVWAVSHTDVLTGAVSEAKELELPTWLALWIPPETVKLVAALLADVGKVLSEWLPAAPTLADGITAAAWLVWGLGAAFLVLAGAGGHVLAVAWQRGSTRAATGQLSVHTGS